MSRAWRDADGGIRLAVRATPRSRQDEAGGMWLDADGQSWLSVKVRAAPDDGQANKAVIAVLAKALDVPKSAIILESGASSRLKRFIIVCKTYEIEARLTVLAGGIT